VFPRRALFQTGTHANVYVTRQEIETEIPPAYVIEALDDNADGVEDSGLFENLVAMASQDVDAALAGRYATPFADPAPAPVRAAAYCFLGERLYTRRERTGDKNPFEKRADGWRKKLELYAKGDLHLDLAVQAQLPDVAGKPAGAAVTEAASIDDSLR
jgi:phage gp36-like protein